LHDDLLLWDREQANLDASSDLRAEVNRAVAKLNKLAADAESKTSLVTSTGPVPQQPPSGMRPYSGGSTPLAATLV